MTKRRSTLHSLMYSTAILCAVCGIPAIALFAVLMWLRGDMTPRAALEFAGVMLAIVITLAGCLWLGATILTKRQQSRVPASH
jgi:hypothetical protein